MERMSWSLKDGRGGALTLTRTRERAPGWREWCDERLFNLWMRSHRYGGLPTGHLKIFDCTERVGIPNTQDVQGSTVLNPRIVKINCNLSQETE